MPALRGESEIQNRKSKIENPKCLASGRQDAGGVEVVRAGRAGGARSQRVAPNPKSRIENPKSKTENSKSKSEKRNWKMEIGNSKTANLKPKMGNHQSSIFNSPNPQPLPPSAADFMTPRDCGPEWRDPQRAA